MVARATGELLSFGLHHRAGSGLALLGSARQMTFWRLFRVGARYDRFVGIEVFVGRDREVGVLRDLLTAVEAGVGGVVLVTGEQGVGKSSLLRAGLKGAEGRRCRVLWGAADELGQRIPLWLMADCLKAVERVTADDELMGGNPVLAGVERLLAVVDRLCAESPVVLVAEDLQWADEASLLMWHRLSRAAEQMALLLAGSSQPAPGREDLARLRRSVAARRAGSVLGLGPLADREVRELVGAMAGGRPGKRLAGVVERAGGNPLYARELVDGLVRQKRVLVEGGVAELVGASAAVRVPASLAAAIEGRLGALPEDAEQVLRWAALLGNEFSMPDLEVVTGRSAGELMKVVDAAAGAGLLAEAGMRLGFQHGLIRQALYERMPAGLRAALHLQAARMLAEAGAAPERVAAQLAPPGLDLLSGQLVYVLAGRPADEWVVAWLADAAPVLTYRAPEVAAELLRGVLSQVPRGDPRRAGLEARRVEALSRLRRYEEAARAGVRLLADDSDPQRVAETTWLVTVAMMGTERVAEAVAQVTQGLARPGLNASQTARLRALLAMTLAVAGEVEQADDTAQRALAEAEQAGDRFAAAHALHTLAMVSYYRRERVAQLEYIDRALPLTETDPQATSLRITLLINMAYRLLELDDRAEATAAARTALTLAEQAASSSVRPARIALGHLHFEFGEWDDALAELEPDVGTLGTLPSQLMLHGMFALIAGHRGDRETAAKHLHAVKDMDLSIGDVWLNSFWVLLGRSLAAEQEGRVAAATAVLAQCLAPRSGTPADYRLLPALTRLALAGGDREAAEAAARLAEIEAQREPLPFVTAVANHCLGLVDGDPAPVLASAAHFMTAGRPFYRAQALEDAAVLEAERGELAGARQSLAEAVRVYVTLGATWDVQHAGARLQPYGVRLGRSAYRTRPMTGWEALTPTEAKVAYLVADGRSNPDVAAALFLSRNTVQTHVSHILAKLGARSRTEIIREAVQHSSLRRPTTA
jgi:DNA-binding CsgD family transcriptional regulator/tetratricopeptide (TPR) repeat protein